MKDQIMTGRATPANKRTSIGVGTRSLHAVVSASQFDRKTTATDHPMYKKATLIRACDFDLSGGQNFAALYV